MQLLVLVYRANSRRDKNVNASDLGVGLVIQNDNKIVVAGEHNSGSLAAHALRFNTNGTIDTTFGPSSTGVAIFNYSTTDNDYFWDMIQDSSGRLLGIWGLR